MEAKKRAAEEARKQEEARKCAAEAKKREEDAKRKAADSAQPVKLFMSYARGPETTKFAREAKAYLEGEGFIVWMVSGGSVHSPVSFDSHPSLLG